METIQKKVLSNGVIALDLPETHKLVEQIDHLRNQFSEAVSQSKIILVRLEEKITFSISFNFSESREYFHSSYSGGNNLVTNYEIIPVVLYPIEHHEGNEILTTANFPASIKAEWDSVKDLHKYVVRTRISAKSFQNWFTDRPRYSSLGGVINLNQNSHVCLLPRIKTELSHDYYASLNKIFYWQLSLVKSLKALNTNDEQIPDWFSRQDFASLKENDILKSKQNIIYEIELKNKQILELEAELEREREFQVLIYGTGKPLEKAVLCALTLLGFQAENYEDDIDEFDAIFEYNHERFLCEFEGKEKQAINTTKIRQLVTNIISDFEKDEVQVQAKGILIGNSHRLMHPTLRTECFTDKCQSVAKSNSIKLINSVDLFNVTLQLRDNFCEEFANECRKAILETEYGIVKFPKRK